MPIELAPSACLSVCNRNKTGQPIKGVSQHVILWVVTTIIDTLHVDLNVFPRVYRADFAKCLSKRSKFQTESCRKNENCTLCSTQFFHKSCHFRNSQTNVTLCLHCLTFIIIFFLYLGAWCIDMVYNDDNFDIFTVLPGNRSMTLGFKFQLQDRTEGFLIYSILRSVVNPNLEVRSSRRVHNTIQLPFC